MFILPEGSIAEKTETLLNEALI